MQHIYYSLFQPHAPAKYLIINPLDQDNTKVICLMTRFPAASPVPARRRRWPLALRRSSRTPPLSSYLEQRRRLEIKGWRAEDASYIFQLFFSSPFEI